MLRTMVDAGDEEDVASVSAKRCFCAAVAYASDAVGRPPGVPKLDERLKALAIEVGAPALSAASSRWVRSTGFSVGVWTHWLDCVLHHHGKGPGPVWKVTAPKHDPKIRLDWQSLRKGPGLLPKNQAEFLAQEGVRNLNTLDAGWLLDQHNSSHPINLNEVKPAPMIVQRLRHHLNDISDRKNHISALEWVTSLSTADARDDHDPRASEWTALEILRQLIERIREPDGIGVAGLDELHPSNILLPRTWLSKAPSGNSFHSRWTWESWKHSARSGDPRITLVRHTIEDFRRQSPEPLRRGDEQAL